MQYLNEILNWISMSLMLPVVVLLLAGVVIGLFSLGAFCSRLWEQVKEQKKQQAVMRRLEEEGPGALELLGSGTFARRIRELAALNWDAIHCEKRIADFNRVCARELEQAKFMMKIGPMLGLMGTLIPMGPALAGLASGDIASMAYNMQIAFATTVVGIVIAGIGLLIYSVKRHWYAAEIADLQYILDLKLREAVSHEPAQSLQLVG